MVIDPVAGEGPGISQPAPARRGWICALWGGILSFFVPGLGQVYAGQWRRGVVIFFLYYVLVSLGVATVETFSPSLLALLGVLSVYVCAILVDLGAVIAAVRRIRTFGLSSRHWIYSTWFMAILGVPAGYLYLDWIGLRHPAWRSLHIASMSGMPTLLRNDFVLAGLRRAGDAPKRGDLLAFSVPGRDPLLVYIGRVVGLPGDHVQLVSGRLYLNDMPVPRERIEDFKNENFGKTGVGVQYIETVPGGRPHRITQAPEGGPLDDTPPLVVPDGSFFYLGDNRDNALDSRVDQKSGGPGFIPIKNIIGSPRLIYWSSNPGRVGTHVE